MRCPEVQHTFRQFIDGRVDADTRKHVGLHLANCPECSRLINDDKFWDDAVLALIEHEAPPDLRARILGDAGFDKEEPITAKRVDLKRMDNRTRWSFLRWAATRKSSRRDWLEIAAVVIIAILMVYFIPRLS